MYHRINTATSDTWQLAVSPRLFEEQLLVLKKYNVIPLQQLVTDLKETNIAVNSIALTFDDGYADNYITAKPLLQQHDIPATFFITNTLGNTEKEFWWDALEFILLENNDLPGEINLIVENEYCSWNLKGPWQSVISQAQITEVASWLPWAEPPTAKHALFLHLSEVLKKLLPGEKEKIINELFKLSGKTFFVRKEYKVMTTEQVVALSDNNLFEVGGHSANHIALGKFDKKIQQSEITSNKNYLEALVGEKITGYGYAHGSYNNDSIDLLKRDNFSYACTTEEKAVSNDSNTFQLPRMQVKNWDKQKFTLQLERLLNN
jgi:peptidoglycan/xylan/chitin deacetylase (PgdA/CDA1 family)